MVKELKNAPKVARGVRLKDVARQTGWWLKWANEDLDRAIEAKDTLETAWLQGRVSAFEDVSWFLETAPWKNSSVLHKNRLFMLIPAAIVAREVVKSLPEGTFSVKVNLNKKETPSA